MTTSTTTTTKYHYFMSHPRGFANEFKVARAVAGTRPEGNGWERVPLTTVRFYVRTYVPKGRTLVWFCDELEAGEPGEPGERFAR